MTSSTAPVRGTVLRTVPGVASSFRSPVGARRRSDDVVDVVDADCVVYVVARSLSAVGYDS